MSKQTFLNLNLTAEGYIENNDKCSVRDFYPEPTSINLIAANNYWVGEWWWEHYYPVAKYHYPTITEDKGKIAIAISKMLFEKKYISPKKVEEFCQIMDDILKAIG